ncbi:MAG: cation:proton antiporter, partial [Phycisphaeraceae bacterium]|nr:cation:proton antiporter [Phycisphaeraceae bacterium]
MDIDIWNIIGLLVALLAAAMLLGAIAERLKQSAVVGYMLAGVLVSLLIPLIGADDTEQATPIVQAISQLGIVLLLFSVGLEFSFERLKKFGIGPWILGGAQVTVTLAATMAIGTALGLSAKGAFIVGAAVSLSSTAVVLRALQERSEVDTLHGRRALGVLLFQDLAVIPLVLIVGSLGQGTSVSAVGIELARQFGIAAGLFTGFYLINRFILPLFLAAQMLARNRELPILFAVVMAMAAAWSADYLGISAALGAFVAGILLGESRLATQIRADVAALRILFVTLFFAGIGMLLNVQFVIENPLLTLGAVLATVGGKATLMSIIGLLSRQKAQHAIALGFTVSQVGVFAFVLLGLGLDQQLIEKSTFDLMVAVAVGTIFATPYVVIIGPALGRRVERLIRRYWGHPPIARADPPTPDGETRPRVIV